MEIEYPKDESVYKCPYCGEKYKDITRGAHLSHYICPNGHKFHLRFRYLREWRADGRAHIYDYICLLVGGTYGNPDFEHIIQLINPLTESK